MTVTFCGHNEVESGEGVGVWLDTVVRTLITEGADSFYLGGYGGFDRLAASVVHTICAEHTQIQSILVLPYLDSKMDVSLYSSTVYPGLESVPRRYAISRRNKWMVENADVVVAYVQHSWGGAAKTLEMAQRSHKRIIRFGEKFF